jgi:hypothetical protein
LTQNFANDYSRTHLGNTDCWKDVTAVIYAQSFSGNEVDVIPLNYDSESKTAVSNSYDADSFLAGLTSRALLRCLGRSPEFFALQLDATFKPTQ